MPFNGCQNLIQHNQKKIDKELRTDNPAGDDVIVLESSSEETEALNLVSEINDLVKKQDYQYTDIIYSLVIKFIIYLSIRFV